MSNDRALIALRWGRHDCCGSDRAKVTQGLRVGSNRGPGWGKRGQRLQQRVKLLQWKIGCAHAPLSHCAERGSAICTPYFLGSRPAARQHASSSSSSSGGGGGSVGGGGGGSSSSSSSSICTQPGPVARKAPARNGAGGRQQGRHCPRAVGRQPGQPARAPHWGVASLHTSLAATRGGILLRHTRTNAQSL
jgi:hypothetical protein